MHATELALFDLDGCLVDSTEAITGSIRQGLATLALDVPADRSLTWCVGPPLRESLERLLTELEADPALAPACMDAYREVYRRTWRERTRVFDGITDALAALADRGVTMAVVTSKPAPIARPIVEGVGLDGWFAALHAPDADHRAEPKAATLRRALDELAPDGSSADAVMIGDREHDVRAGVACGTRTVGVTWGAGDRAELLAAGADRVVDEPGALPAAVVREGTYA